MVEGVDNKSYVVEQGDLGGGCQGCVIKLVLVRIFFEGIFQVVEGYGQQQNIEIVGVVQQSGVGDVYFYQQWYCYCDVNFWNNVDKEQLVLVVVFGDLVVYCWVQCWGEGGQVVDCCCGNDLLFVLKKGESGGEYQGDY